MKRKGGEKFGVAQAKQINSVWVWLCGTGAGLTLGRIKSSPAPFLDRPLLWP